MPTQRTQSFYIILIIFCFLSGYSAARLILRNLPNYPANTVDFNIEAYRADSWADIFVRNWWGLGRTLCGSVNTSGLVDGKWVIPIDPGSINTEGVTYFEIKSGFDTDSPATFPLGDELDVEAGDHARIAIGEAILECDP